MTANRQYSVLSTQYSVLSTRYLVLGTLALAIALMPFATGQAAEYVKKSGNGTLRLQPDKPKLPESLFKVDGDVVESRLSNGLLLTLSIEGQAPIKITGGDDAALKRLLKALTDSGLCYPPDLKPTGPPKHTDLGDGKERWEVSLRFSLIPPNESIVELLLPMMDCTEGANAQQQRVFWQPVKLRITTTVPEKDPKQLRPITDVEDPPPPPPSWTRWLRWAGIVVAGLGLIAGLWSLRHRFASPAKPLPSHEWAVRELDRIEALRLPESAEVERYHTLLSDVMRTYLEQRFQLPASHQTTTEFLETMHRSPQLTPAQRHLLRDFLDRCDLAKFARAVPSPPECRAVADMARSFVKETIPPADGKPPAALPRD